LGFDFSSFFKEMIMSSTISSLSSSTWVNSLFSKIDTKNQGYIDKRELQSALEQISSDSSSSVDKIFSKLDADDDGKITKQEMSDGMQKLAAELDSQFNASRIKGAGRGDGADDAGFTKEELASQLKKIGDTDSKRTTVMTSIINNFDKADTDGNGKVTRLEAMAYDQENQVSAAASGANAPPPPPPPSNVSASDSSTNTSSSTYAAADANKDGTVSLEELLAYQSANEATASNDSSTVMKVMMQLLQAYGVLGQESSQSAASNSISVIA
jgi:Ca2+-binding EF-hand superfamily protein